MSLCSFRSFSIFAVGLTCTWACSGNPPAVDAEVPADMPGPVDSESADTDTELPSGGDIPWRSAGSRCPEAAERFLPVVISAGEVPELAGHPVDAVGAYALERGWRRVPLQIDERVEVDAPSPHLFYVIADSVDERFRRDDGDGLDSDDEIVLPKGGFGARAQVELDELPPGRRIELEITDPAGGSQRFVYLVAQDEPVQEAPGAVSYVRVTCADDPDRLGGQCQEPWGKDLEDTVVSSDCYDAHFEMNFVWDRLAVSEKAGGTGENLLDRWKGRAFGNPKRPFSPPRCEVEDSSERILETEGTQSFCQGWSGTDDHHYYVGHKVGPLRAIRVVLGACSFKNLMRTMVFSRVGIEDRIWMRGHAVPAWAGGLGFYIDYRKEATPLRYERQGLDRAVILDGKRDFKGNVNGHILSSEQRSAGWWEQVSGALGSLGIFSKQVVPLPGGDEKNTVGFYQLDDKNFDDGTGSQPGVYGGHGLRFRKLAATDDDPAGFVQIYRPLEADAPSVGQKLHKFIDNPFRVRAREL